MKPWVRNQRLMVAMLYQPERASVRFRAETCETGPDLSIIPAIFRFPSSSEHRFFLEKSRLFIRKGMQGAQQFRFGQGIQGDLGQSEVRVIRNLQVER